MKIFALNIGNRNYSGEEIAGVLWLDDENVSTQIRFTNGDICQTTEPVTVWFHVEEEKKDDV